MNSPTVGRIAKYLWIAAILWVAALNIQPYLSIITELTTGIIAIPLGELFLKIPIIGPAMALLALMIPGLVAIAIYILIQLLQCLPMLLASPEVVRARIAAGEQWQHLSIRAADPGWLRELKMKLNNFPLEWISSIHKGSKAAYAVDLVLSGMQYPLFKDGWLSAIQNWNSLGLWDVRWGNIPGFVTMIFAFEGAIWLYLKLSEGVDIFNAPPAPRTQPREPRERKQPRTEPMSW
ncbi:MAG: hypothetical protein HC857_01100 [Synechococcales cyanobacterium RU_4_20]|nr:hypothetical protein [Synechococcales cyanobacterium RU_4_20]NJR71330.1 hypothetical protein [Synechococcales cyanobacterium CRU_2_2]